MSGQTDLRPLILLAVAGGAWWAWKNDKLPEGLIPDAWEIPTVTGPGVDAGGGGSGSLPSSMPAKITQNFTLQEAKCKDGTVPPVRLLPNLQRVAANMEALRRQCGNRPVTVVSWYRTQAYNDRQPGAVSDSQHVQGLAMDVRIQGLTPAQVAAIIEAMISSGRMQEGGVGTYATFTHYDCRGTRARWGGTAE